MPAQEPRRRGRPRLPRPEAPQAMTIRVHDLRPEVRPRELGVHHNVPGDLSPTEILRRFGIAAHLRVLCVAADGEQTVLQAGRTR